MTSSVQNSRERRVSAKHRRKRAKSVYISAPLSQNISIIRRILEDEGARTVTADDAEANGGQVGALSKGISAADLVVAVLGPGAANSNVLFELGVAQGLGKNSLLILPKASASSRTLPFDLLTLPHLRSEPDDEKTLRFGLSRFLAAPHHGRDAIKVTPSATHPIGTAADGLLAKIRSRDSVEGTELLELIAKALSHSGVQVKSNWKADSCERAKMAVWSEDLSIGVGNPFLIELIGGILTTSKAHKEVDDLQEFIRRTGVRSSLLLYWKASAGAADVLKRSPILAMSIEEFLEALRDAGFGELMRKLRNNKAHGSA